MSELDKTIKFILESCIAALKEHERHVLADSLYGVLHAFETGRTQPEATAPAQDLGAAIPDGWQLVPKAVTREMQKAYFDVIDKNMPRVMKDARFGRWDSHREAYKAMLAAALASPADALVEGDRVDAEPFNIAPVEVRKVMRATLKHGAWIERTGPLDLWALHNEHGFVRMLHRFEIEFVDGAIAAAIQAQKDGHG